MNWNIDVSKIVGLIKPCIRNVDDESLYSDELYEILNSLIDLNYEPGQQLFGYSDAVQGDTNLAWSKKHLKMYKSDRFLTVSELEKKFELLIQFDLMKDFINLGDGVAYFGYLPAVKHISDYTIQCELQNT